MENKKEVQQSIDGESKDKVKSSDEEFYNVLRSIAPGTNIRNGLDGIINAGKGALIAVENSGLWPMVDSGFRVNARFTHQRLIELSKMDGAIILSRDMKRILLANALLIPSGKMPSRETGTRHKAAERTARQAGTLVVAVSERRNEITVFYKNVRYPIKDSNEILRKANEHIQMLEKQRELFDKAVDKLTKLELRNYPGLHQAAHAIQKGKIVTKISSELNKDILELGKEGTLLKTRLRELTDDVEKETDLIIKDYTQIDMKKTRAILDELSYEELFDKENILSSLAFETPIQTELVKGWRILSKTSLPEQDIASIIKESGSLGRALYSGAGFYRNVLGDEKAKAFKEEIENFKLNM